MGKKYLKLFVDCLEKYRKLNDAEFGRLIRAALSYTSTGVEVELMGREELLWDGMKLDIGKVHKGPGHWNWKGGITPQNQVGRSSSIAKNWRLSVFKRDNYTCQRCRQHGGKLNAHHIKPWAKYKNVRFDINNGITLCETCHKEIHRRVN